jgi:ATP-binding cassette subfamily F protein 3
LLDEPTNHLDMRAKDVLLDSLKKYSGTIVFVSHDRYFIDNLADRIFEIEDGHVHVYPGNYEDYLWRKAGGPEQVYAQTVAPVAVEPEPAAMATELKKRVNPMKVEKLRARLKEVELEVASLESEIAQHDAALGDFKSVEETVRLTGIVEERRKQLEARVAEWEEVSAELEGS